ncbi:hypothetical protein HPP92_018251 [Vanilla planifolia]|uniref:Uncharacterized protein n=1 Tax=Vanilla planifolia TaxID=51239 RepID=A0A835UPB6_VANPL|nr:hypothetical protein HPP92_018251 [Vanilla planifolia]
MRLLCSAGIDHGEIVNKIWILGQGSPWSVTVKSIATSTLKQEDLVKDGEMKSERSSDLLVSIFGAGCFP